MKSLIAVVVCAVAALASPITGEEETLRQQPNVIWSPPTYLLNGLLTSAHLNATADVPGTFRYTAFHPFRVGGTFEITAGMQLEPGAYLLAVEFTPADLDTYAPVQRSQSWERMERLVVDAALPGYAPLRRHAELPSGAYGAFTNMAFDGRGHLYMASLDGRVIEVYDATTHQLINSIEVPGMMPRIVALHESSGRLYVSDRNWSTHAMWVLELDATRTAAATHRRISLPMSGEETYAMVLNPVTGLIYLGGPSLYVIAPDLPDGDPGLLREILPGPISLTSLGLNVRTGRLYANTFPRLTVIDVTKADGTAPDAIAELDLGGSSYFDGGVVIDRSTDDVIGVQSGLRSPRPNVVFIMDGRPDSPRFHQVSAQIPLEHRNRGVFEFGTYVNLLNVGGLAINESARRLYLRSVWPEVSDIEVGYSDVTTIDLVQRRTVAVTTTFPHRVFPWASHPIAVNQSTGEVYASNHPGVDVLHDTLAVTAPVTPAQPSGQAVATFGHSEIRFSSVLSAGEVTIEPMAASEAALDLPGQFAIEGLTAFDIHTSASVAGPVTVCFDVSYVDDPDVFGSLRILHGEGGGWVDRTTYRDFSTRRVCAETSSLSPFAIARLRADYVAISLHATDRAVRRGSTVPLKVRVLNMAGANMSSPLVTLRAVRVTRVSTDAAALIQNPGEANPDSNFRFSPDLAGYIFNLHTGGLTSGVYEVQLRASGDDRTHVTTFQVK